MLRTLACKCMLVTRRLTAGVGEQGVVVMRLVHVSGSPDRCLVIGPGLDCKANGGGGGGSAKREDFVYVCM